MELRVVQLEDEVAEAEAELAERTAELREAEAVLVSGAGGKGTKPLFQPINPGCSSPH